MPYRHPLPSPYRVSPSEPRANWTIWWDMHRRAGSDGWSRAMEGSEEDALQRAARFLKLGFVVYAIRDPTGALYMDETQIAGHFTVRDQLALASLGRDNVGG